MTTLTWRQGPSLDIALTTSVEYGDTFLLVGGFEDGPTELDTIYEYDSANERWKLRPERLSEGKDTVVAFIVDDAIVDCS